DVCTSRGRCLPPESIGAAIASPLPEPESAILRIEPERISLSGPTHDAQVGIANEGGLPLPFRFEVDRSWVDVQPPKGVLAPGQRLDVTVRVAGDTQGTSDATLTIVSEAGTRHLP